MGRLVIGVVLLVAASFGYTLLTQSFNGAWSPNFPPFGWRIYHSDTSNVRGDDWHRDSATRPWGAHPTAFAAIFASSLQDTTPDSLISPVIDCRGCGQVTLRCSTNFLPANANPYTAQIVYSVDSGLTFPYVAKDYYDLNTGTICESLVLDQAHDKAGVVLAWVFDGDLMDITSWFTDDVAVTGESLDLYDMAVTAIVAPGDTIWSGELTPSARFRNLGDTEQVTVPVACTLYDNAMAVIATWAGTVGPILPGDDTLVTFLPAYSVDTGDYYIRFSCRADSDYFRANDTLGKSFTAPAPSGLLFAENFDGAWSTNNPPAGWRIFHTLPTDDNDRDDWHREDANTTPWIDHPTPFAAIGPSAFPDNPPDSLISPVINCAGYGNITLICSTYFIRWSSQPYIAKLVYSTDGGLTWPYTLHDYYLGSSPDPVRESLELDSAMGKANVRLAWVYDGDINYIQWLSVDDISVAGELTSAVRTDPSLTPRARSLSLDLFPNPCRDRVTVRCLIPLPAPTSLTLYDASGRSVFTRPIAPSTPRSLSYSLDLRNLSLGIYVVRLESGGRSVARKLVVGQ